MYRLLKIGVAVEEPETHDPGANRSPPVAPERPHVKSEIGQFCAVVDLKPPAGPAIAGCVCVCAWRKLQLERPS